MESRWSELEDSIAEQGEKASGAVKRIKAHGKSQGSRASHDGAFFKHLLRSPLSVSLATALLVILVLLVIRPPFIYSRRRSKIHPDFYVEEFSPGRLFAWAAIAGVVALAGTDAGRMYRSLSRLGTAMSAAS